MAYKYKQYRRRNLPHIHSPGAILFVTFRLAGSIPQNVLKEWKAERIWLEQEIQRVEKDLNQWAKLLDFYRRWFKNFEDILHQATIGPTWLKDQQVAKLIADSLQYTAQEANKMLNRSGAFWAVESYDHEVKDEKEYKSIVRYVLNNPVKSGLVEDWRDWPWSWKRE